MKIWWKIIFLSHLSESALERFDWISDDFLMSDLVYIFNFDVPITKPLWPSGKVMWNLKVASSNPWWVRFWKFQISCPGMKKKTQTKNQIIGCLDNGRNGRKIPPEQAGLWSLRCWHEVLFWGAGLWCPPFGFDFWILHMGCTLQHGYLLLMHVLVPIPSDDYDVLEQNIIQINNFPLLTTGSKKLEEKLSKFSFLWNY